MQQRRDRAAAAGRLQVGCGQDRVAHAAAVGRVSRPPGRGHDRRASSTCWAWSVRCTLDGAVAQQLTAAPRSWPRRCAPAASGSALSRSRSSSTRTRYLVCCGRPARSRMTLKVLRGAQRDRRPSGCPTELPLNLRVVLCHHIPGGWRATNPVGPVPAALHRGPVAGGFGGCPCPAAVSR